MKGLSAWAVPSPPPPLSPLPSFPRLPHPSPSHRLTDAHAHHPRSALRREVDGLPIVTLGDASVDGLRRLLDAADAKPGGPRHIVLTDLREELVL